MYGSIIADSAWEKSRLGKITSSQYYKLISEPRNKEAKEKGEFSDAGKTYLQERAAELLTGYIRKVDTVAIEWGNNFESEAFDNLKKIYPDAEYFGTENKKFFPLTDLSGGSPDGVESKLKLVFEIKCPENPSNHIFYMLIKSAQELKKTCPDHYCQIQMYMACMARHYNVAFSKMNGIFASYCPLVLEKYQHRKLVTLEVPPDMEFYEKLYPTISKAENYLAGIVEQFF